MIKSLFMKLFRPATFFMSRLSFFSKVLLFLCLFLLPLVFTSYFTYTSYSKKLQIIDTNIDDIEKNYALYKMIFLVQDYEQSAKKYLKNKQNQASQEELEKSKKRLLAASSGLLGCLSEKLRSYCTNYYEHANLALLNKDIVMLSKYTHEYKYFLYKKIVSVDLKSFLKSKESVDKFSYLLSVELPFSSVLVAQSYDLDNRDETLIRLGKIKGSVEKMDLLFQGFDSYSNHFESLNLKYKASVDSYIKYSLEEDYRRSMQMQDSVLSLQLSLFNSMQSFLDKYLQEERKVLVLRQNIFMIFILFFSFLFFYFLIGAYLSLSKALRIFFTKTHEVSKGKLKARIEIENTDELGSLAVEFNHMIENLDYHYALLNEYKKAVDSSAIVVKTDLNGIITYVNTSYEKISAYSRNELIGSSHRLIKSKNTSPQQIEELWSYISNKKTYKTIFENIAKTGKTFFVESTIIPILDNSGEISEYISIMFDITPLYRQKEKLQSQLYKDELTSLPNRLKLIEDISCMQKTKLVVINIDGFKEINTIYGENIGDLTLQKMAKEIKNALNTRHLQLYKLSADEFAILAGKNISIEYFKEDVTMLSHYLSHLKLECGEHEVSVRLSLGAAISELHLSQRPLISMADMALKEAKRRMKPYLFYNDIAYADEDLNKNYKMINIIEKAIKNDKVGCSYQGIINAKTGQIEKYETLMRLEDEEGNKISPQDFVGLAKRARYYPQLTQKVVQEALFTFIKRKESVSINLSIDDLMDDNTYGFIIDALRNCGCADRVVFELLETEEIELNERVFEFTSTVKKLGAQIAIDDFGSGYSNYAYLMKLGVDILKIDASLIKEVDTSNSSRLIVRSIIDIAHALGMKTVAEHVHTKEIKDIMVEMGVDYLQGYYLHEPVSVLEAP
ncbi:MAG: hypothetical protein COA44_05860 [Arcobacter sp.]|nr:MAG: hypothetical protein COA44_05860 [Arcobacter sp.]